MKPIVPDLSEKIMACMVEAFEEVVGVIEKKVVLVLL